MSATPFTRFVALVPNKDQAIARLRPGERLWGVDQHYLDQATGKVVPVMNYFGATVERLVEVLRRIAPEHRNCYEMLRPGCPCVLYFDWENHEIDVDALMAKVKEFIRTVPGLEAVDEVRFGVKDACRAEPKKISRHVLVWMFRAGREVRLQDISSAGALARRFVASLIPLELVQLNDKERLPADVLTFDLGVYTRDRQFRLPGNDKWGQGRPTCPVVAGGVKLTPDEALDVLGDWLIQDPRRTFAPEDIVAVAEADGAPASSSSLGILPYRRTRYPDAADFVTYKEVVGTRKRRAEPAAASASSLRGGDDTDPARQRIEPCESLFAVTPAWNRTPMPVYFLNSFRVLLQATLAPDPLPPPPAQVSGETTSFHRMTFNRETMPASQLAMLALIRPPLKKGTPAEKAALDFIPYSAASRLNLGELCAQWLLDLTGDTRIALKDFDDDGFMLSCPRTKLCHTKGGEHANNKIFFVFNVQHATATQYCHDDEYCAGRPRTLIELPPNLKAVMCLAWHWRSLFLQSAF